MLLECLTHKHASRGGEVSLVHSWRAINVLPAYGSVLPGFGGYLLFFCPKPPSVNSSAFLLWGTYPASDYELVTSAEAVLFPCNILLLQATELGGTRLESGQSESSPRTVYKLELKKKSIFLLFLFRGLDFNKTQELLVATSPLLSCNEKIKCKMQRERGLETKGAIGKL